MLREKSLAQMIEETESAIRAKPTDTEPRWLLFQLLCLTGTWDRAQNLLPTATGSVAPGKIGATAVAKLYQRLIEAEKHRTAVFAGLRAPEFLSHPPEWTLALIEALAFESIGDQTKADQQREVGLEAAPTVTGQTPQGRFDWLADADSRLGPVFEVIQSGVYYWVPLNEISSLFHPEPARIIDLVWSPVSLALTNGQVLQGHVPARYPGAEVASDSIRLGHQTQWREQGRTGTFGSGQKMWMHNAGEWAMRDIRECHFVTPTDNESLDSSCNDA